MSNVDINDFFSVFSRPRRSRPGLRPHSGWGPRALENKLGSSDDPGAGSRDAFLLEDKVSYSLTPNTVELIPTLGALLPRGGPVQDPVLTDHGQRSKGR